MFYCHLNGDNNDIEMIDNQPFSDIPKDINWTSEKKLKLLGDDLSANLDYAGKMVKKVMHANHLQSIYKSNVNINHMENLNECVVQYITFNFRSHDFLYLG